MDNNSTNYVIYHRNNKMLDLTNHFELDGDLDPNYLLLRNRALTGVYYNNVFHSQSPKTFAWLIECAKTKKKGQHCNLCKGIFTDVFNDDYSITKFYRENVVTIDENTPIQHPLLDYIIDKFKGTIIK